MVIDPGVYCVNSFFNSLRFRLLVLVLLALVPALGLVVYTASEQRRLAAIQAQENALRLTRVAATNQEQLIWGTRQLLVTLAQLPAVQEREPVACNQILASLVHNNPHYTAIAVVELDETSVCRAVPPNDSPNGEVNSPILHDVFLRARQTQGLVVSQYGIGPYSGRGILAFGYPILDESRQVRAVLSCTLDVASLNQLAAQALLPPGSTLTANDRFGTILARYPESEKWVGHSAANAPIIQTILSQQREGTVETIGEDGVQRLYAFTPLSDIPGNEIFVSVGIPSAVAFAEANQILMRNLIALGLVALLTLSATWVSSQVFFLRQLNALLNATGRLANGDLSARTGLPHGASELGQVANAFDRMVDSLEQRESQRKQAEERVRHQAARAESLVRAAEHLNAQLDLREVLGAVCEEAAHALAVPAANIRLYDEDRDAFCFAAGYGLSTEYIEHLQPLPRGALDQSALQTGSVISISDVRKLADLPDADVYIAMGVRSVVRASMLREGQLIGVLSVFTFGEPRDLTDDDETLLRGLATQAALAIANARLYAALQHEEHARAELLHRVITAQEDERMRIARELHDETSQNITTLMMGLAVARKALADSPQKVEEQLQAARTIAMGMLEGIHRLIEDLRPSLLDVLGLVPAITWLGEQRLNPLGIELHLNESDLGERLPATTETVLFRIVQEALTNVIRHAQATRVDIRLARENGNLLLRIADNGRGFDSSLRFDEKSFGLHGMQERVSILRGTFHLKTEPNQGTVITICIPISNGGKPSVQDPRHTGR